MKNNTVLIIEDNKKCRKLLRTLLELEEYHVLEAADAENGISLIQKEKPALILMDIKLPGADGLEAAQRIKNDPVLKEIPIVAVTAYAMNNDKEKALTHGCDGYLTKPISIMSFLDTVTGFVKKKDPTKRRFRKSHKSRILIIDDDPRNVKLLMGKLPDKYEIITAYNGEDGLEKTYKEFPDLILLDIMMPGMDGYEVTGRLKNNPDTRDIPIILITALDGTDDKIRGLNVGADEFLSKPIDTAELQARVQSLLRLKTYHEQLITRTQSQQAFMTPDRYDESEEKLDDFPMIVLIEDSALDAKLILACLDGLPYQIRTFGNGKDAVAFVQKEQADIVLLDLNLPDMDGFEFLDNLRKTEHNKNTQVVVITGSDDHESKLRSIELGTDDFLLKPVDREEIRARTNALIRKKAYLDQLNDRFETALNAAITDRLTMLYNHTYFKHFLEREIKRSHRQNHPLALIMIDVDNFKKYNDTRGHLAGDRVLQQTSRIVRDNIREIDLAARYGGEEFAIVLPHIDMKDALAVAERVRKAIAAHAFPREAPFPPDKVTVSMGVAFSPTDAASVEELIKKADQQLYRAKDEGKNCVCTTEHLSLAEDKK
ncbi:Two component system response regulator, GGDEF domain-containing [Desulfonema magnum]|uniref:Two component system response regulator, GGDEF domain-containing n=2 Tax=Desulfonema magnum TaxID=45655 RepID=A0A975GK93_9BACT|nr:Two component system response regulator, GGDEF domain-containing [Desulfonema magnum]